MTEPTPTSGVAGIRHLDSIETPAYVYDLDEMRRAHALLSAALPRPSRLFYSLKANPHPALVRALTRLGCCAEICSPGEVAATREAGAPLHRALYTGPGKRDEEVAAAIEAGVRWFSVDSPAGLDQVSRAAQTAGVQASCLLRINDWAPAGGQGLTMSGVPSQFGADAEWVVSDPGSFSARPAAGLAGLHLYMGTNLSTVESLVAQFGRAIGTARRVADALRLDPSMLDLGGGFGAPYARSGPLPRFAGLAAAVADLLDASFPAWRAGSLLVAFESGRYLTATCGSLLTRVVEVKRSHGRPVVILESGINHLGGMSGLRRLPPLVPEVQAGSSAGVLHRAIIAGPLCTPLDTWAHSADLSDVRVGEVVRVPNVGAYGLSASLLAFLGHPAPREVVVDGGRIVEVSQVAVVRRRSVMSCRPDERVDTRWTPSS